MKIAAIHVVSRKKHRVRVALSIFVILLLLLAGAFLWYVSIYYRASAEALAALSTDEAVQVVEVSSGWCFLPTGDASAVGILLYPGGKVDEKAYAPLARDLAEAGYAVALVRMPFRLAVFGIDRGNGAIRDLEIVLGTAERTAPARYVVAGHSLGGVMGARYALTRTDRVVGVALWAAYADQDLKASGLAAMEVHGSEDRVLDIGAVEAARKNLPDSAVSTVIPGGNHAGFGSYGAQAGDGSATITGEEQRRAVVALMTDFIDRLVP